MKRFKNRLAIIMMLMLIFTSFEFVGVFAEGDDNAPAEATTVEESQDVVDDAAPAEEVAAPAAVEEEAVEAEDAESDDEALPEEEADAPAITNQEGEGEGGEEPGITAKDLEIQDLQLLSGYQCVVLRWKKINIAGANVEYYVDGNKVSVSKYDYIPGRLTGDYVMYKIDKPVSEGKELTEYSFKVQAKATVAATGEVVSGEAKESNKRAPVRTIAYTFKVKTGTKLKKHGGNGPKTYKLKAGQTLVCYGFGGGGCYMFKRKNSKGESIFYCAKIRAKSPKAIYTKKFNYTAEEAELYVSQRQAAEKKMTKKSQKAQKGVKSKTKVFVWVNTYTQHLYYFKKVDGKWKCTDNWECSSGKASAPSPTGMYGVKKIEGKWRRHHNIPYWSKYSGTNSIHGKKGNLTSKNAPMSNGCIRNPNKKAKIVYDGAKVGTGVIIF